MDKEVVLLHVYTMECYSAIKRNEFESVLVRWMSLESVIRSGVSQKENCHALNKNLVSQCSRNITYPLATC